MKLYAISYACFKKTNLGLCELLEAGVNDFRKQIRHVLDFFGNHHRSLQDVMIE